MISAIWGFLGLIYDWISYFKFRRIFQKSTGTSVTEVRYRLANHSDIEELTKLRAVQQAKTWAESYPIEENFKIATELYYKKHLNKDVFIVIAEKENDIIATAGIILIDIIPQAYETTGHWAMYDNIYIKPKYKTLKINQYMLKKLEDISAQLGVMSIVWHRLDREEEMYDDDGWISTDSFQRFL